MITHFKRLVSLRFLYAVALQMQAVILGWQMYVLTHDPLFLGLIGLAEAVPALSLALFSGYLVDRGNPLKILRIVVGVGLISGLIMWGTHLPMVHMAVSVQIVALFVSSFLTGVARSFLHPCIYSIVPQLMSRDELAKSSAWMTSAYQIASVSGPAIGGLLFGFFGVFVAASVSCVFLLSTVVLSFVLSFEPQVKALTSRAHFFWKELGLGAKFVFKHPIMLPALTLDMVSVLFGGVTALLPIFAAEILFVGPEGLGILRASPAVGASVVGLWLTRRQIGANAGRWLLSAVTGFGVCTLVFAFSHNYILSLVVLGLAGACDSISAVIRGTIVQLSSPTALRGRISAVNMMFISSSNELGEFESGMAAKLFGTVPAVLLGGIVCLIMVGGVAWFCPALRRLDMRDLEEGGYADLGLN